MYANKMTAFAMSMAIAASVQLSQIADEDSVYIIEPAELKALVEDGMTKELLETVGSQIDVHFKMTTVDEVIDALNAFGPPTKKYDLASLKARIMQGASPSEKNELLKEIFEDKKLGPAITKCDAFELSAFVDPWRALRDLREADPLRAQLKLRGDRSASKIPLEYADACFTRAFSEFEPANDPEFATNVPVYYGLLFSEGVIKPRVKQLLFHSGENYSLPTDYSENNNCTGQCETHFTIQDPDGFKTSTEYKLSVKKESAPAGDKYHDLVEIDWASPASSLVVLEERRYNTESIQDDQDQWMNYQFTTNTGVTTPHLGNPFMRQNRHYLWNGTVYHNLDGGIGTWDYEGVPYWSAFSHLGDEASWATIPKAWKNEYVYGQ